MKTINVAIASDESYLPGAIGALASVRIALEESFDLNVIFLHDGLSEASQEKCRLSVQKISGSTNFEFVKIDQDFSRFPRFPGATQLTYARLLLPDFTKCPRLLYLDADIMVLKSIAPLFEMEIHDSGVAGVIEPGIRTIGADFQLGCPFSVNLEAPYFNAGFLVLDMIKIKKNGLFDRAFSILNQYPEFCKIWDQSPLNYVVNGCFTVLDSDHNFQNSRYYQSPVGFINPLKNRSMNIHFIAPKCKPWQKYSAHPADTMFRMLLDEIYPEWRTREFNESELKTRLRMSFAHFHPFLFRARAMLKRMLGKDFSSDLWAARNWQVFSDDLRESKKRIRELEHLYAGWQSQIRSRLV